MVNYQIVTTGGEIYHHGIKGQKWGIRRFQNEDGSLTDKGKKRLAKLEAYRDRKARSAQSNAEWSTRKSKEAAENIKDLQKNGRSSKAYREWKRQTQLERKWEYERNNEGKQYNGSSDQLVGDIVDFAVSKKLFRN